jgi:hypothetical protein
LANTGIAVVNDKRHPVTNIATIFLIGPPFLTTVIDCKRAFDVLNFLSYKTAI